jgi:MFS family permease
MVMSGFVLALGLTSHAPTALLLLALIGLVDGATDVLFDTIVQREADPRFYGRVFGIATAFMTATMMGAVGMAPLVNGIAPAHQVIFVAGLVLLGASAIALLGTRSKRTVEQAQEPELVPDARPAAVLQLVPSPEPRARGGTRARA